MLTAIDDMSHGCEMRHLRGQNESFKLWKIINLFLATSLIFKQLVMISAFFQRIFDTSDRKIPSVHTQLKQVQAVE